MLFQAVILKINNRGETMSTSKIVRIVGAVLAVLVALGSDAVPFLAAQGGLILGVAGLVVGYYVSAENRRNLFLMVLVLSAGGASGALDAIPVLGANIVSPILTAVTALLAAASVTVITMILKERLTE